MTPHSSKATATPFFEDVGDGDSSLRRRRRRRRLLSSKATATATPLLEGDGNGNGDSFRGRRRDPLSLATKVTPFLRLRHPLSSSPLSNRTSLQTTAKATPFHRRCHPFFDSNLTSLSSLSHWLLGEVLMKPGKPVTFAQISVSSRNEKDSKTVLAFGLPGNPVSCLVCFNLFAVPAIRHLSGWSNPHLQRVQACLKNSVKPHPARPEYHRAVVRWEFNNATGSPGFVAESTGQQMSSRLLSMKSANALLELPATGQILPAGTSVQAILISDISSFPQNKSSGSTSISLHQKHAVKSNNSTCKQMDAASPEKVMVAILTVSDTDTVTSGAGPDRR